MSTIGVRDIVDDVPAAVRFYSTLLGFTVALDAALPMEVSMGPTKDEQNSTRRSGTSDKKHAGFTDEDRGATQERSRELKAAQADFVQAVASRLEADPRVSALWLAGSLGRGEADDLSDVDLVVVLANASYARTLVVERLTFVECFGEVALVLDSPQNAHPDGAQVNVLYDSFPLPTYVDWNFLPQIADRPDDVTVLFERHPECFANGRSYEAMLAEMPRGAPATRTEAGCDHFRLAMTPIVAKLAARGNPVGVERMFAVIGEAPACSLGLQDVLEALSAMVDRLEPRASVKAIASVRRYLGSVATHSIDRGAAIHASDADGHTVGRG